MRYQPQQSHQTKLHRCQASATQSYYYNDDPETPIWTPPDSDDEMDFPPPEDDILGDQREQ